MTTAGTLPDPRPCPRCHGSGRVQGIAEPFRWAVGKHVFVGTMTETLPCSACGGAGTEQSSTAPGRRTE